MTDIMNDLTGVAAGTAPYLLIETAAGPVICLKYAGPPLPATPAAPKRSPAEMEARERLAAFLSTLWSKPETMEWELRYALSRSPGEMPTIVGSTSRAYARAVIDTVALDVLGPDAPLWARIQRAAPARWDAEARFIAQDIARALGGGAP